MTPALPLEDDGAGALTINGARYLLIRPETLAALQKAVEVAAGPRRPPTASPPAAARVAPGRRATLAGVGRGAGAAADRDGRGDGLGRSSPSSASTGEGSW